MVLNNNKGEFTLEAAIVVPVVLFIIVLFLSLMITFSYRGYFEIALNEDLIINDINGKKNQVEKTKDINIILLNKKFILKQEKYDNKFIKQLLIEKHLNKVKSWLDE